MKYLEYIELDGRSFIGTKLSPDDPGLTLEFWVQPGREPWGDGMNVGNGQYAFFVGAEQGSDIWGIKTAVLDHQFVGENCGTYTNDIPYYYGNWYHVVVENGELSVYQVDADGTEYLIGQELFDPSSVSLPNVFIGTLNKEDTDFYDAPCCGVLFSKIIVNGDELLPAEDDEGRHTSEPGTIGWFDEYNGIFYTNGGDGSFIAGPYVGPSIELNPTTEWISAYRYGMTTDIEVICNNSWSVIDSAGLSYNVSGNVISFIVPSNTNTGAGVTYNIEVQDNTTGDIATATITQDSASPISISPSAVTIAASGGAVDAQVICRNDPWMILGRWPDDEVIPTNIVRRHIPANTTQSAITYYIVVQNENTLASATTEITQEAAAPQPVGTNTMFVGAIPVDMLYVGDASASCAYLGDQLVWEPSSPEPPAPSYDEMPLTFEILSAGTIVWEDRQSNHPIQYSTDGGTTWNNMGSSISVNSGDRVSFRGDNPTYYVSNTNYGCFGTGITAVFNAVGNVLSMIDSTNYATSGYVQLSTYALDRLFNGCVGIVSAENLVLPSTTLANYCYAYMFYNCTSLTTAPALPATTLVQSCYNGMFRGCTSLATAPELPATTLADKCYDYMFQGCTSLTTAPELPATTLANYCYRNMFQGCSSLNYIKCLATNISATDCLNNWVNGVAATGTFVKDPNMSSWPTGTSGIPSGWQVVDNA